MAKRTATEHAERIVARYHEMNELLPLAGGGQVPGAKAGSVLGPVRPVRA